MKKRRAILMGSVCVMLFVSLAFSVSVQAGQSPTISIEPVSIEAEQGDTFDINIKVDAGDTEILAAQYVLYFDSSVLNASSQTQGPFLSQDDATTYVAANVINNTQGKLDYGESRMGIERGVTNSGTLASITFDVIGTSGTSYFEFSDVLLSDSEGVEIQDVTTSSGSFSIKSEAAHIPASQPNSIVVEKAYEMLEESPVEIILLDVRTKAEYEAEHIDMPGIALKNIPKDELENRLGELDKTKKIIVYCNTGVNSKRACEILVKHDFENVYNMLGGIEEWKKLRLPISTLHTLTPVITVTPSPSPGLSPLPSPTPTSAASSVVSPTSTPTLSPEGKWGIPGFEAIFAIMGLLAMSYLIIKRKRRDDKK